MVVPGLAPDKKTQRLGAETVFVDEFGFSCLVNINRNDLGTLVLYASFEAVFSVPRPNSHFRYRILSQEKKT